MRITYTSIVMMLAAMLGGFSSCSSSDEPNPEETVEMTFVANIQDFTRAGESTTSTVDVDQLLYSVYDSSGANLSYLFSDNSAGAPKAVKDGDSFKLTLNLISGNSYTIVFWAQNSENTDGYTFNRETGVVTVNYDRLPLNTDKADAFYGEVSKKADGQGGAVMLRRPFAQINVGTTTLDTDSWKNNSSSITVSEVPNTLNLTNGEIGGKVTAQFAPASISTLGSYPVEGYDYLVKAFVLATKPATGGATIIGNEGDPTPLKVDLTVSYAGSEAAKFTGVPVEANKRTNIYGEFLKSEGGNVTINSGTDGDFNVEIP